jgi:hypothetical protein
VVQLHREVDEIRAAGGELVVIGNGAPHFIAGFRSITGYLGQLYTDPSLATYKAMELRSGLRTVLTLGTVVRTVGAFRRGFRQGRTQGHALQQGGTLVVATDGEVLFRHISDGPGDNAHAWSIVESLQR